MSVNGQTLSIRDALSAALAVLMVLAGLYFRGIETSVNKLAEQQDQEATKVHALETMVAAGYPTKDDLNRAIGGVHTRLDRIEDKLDARMGVAKR